MTSESTGVDTLDQYRSISKKLKKTFFKKPNEHEALESYVSLARTWENSDLPAYAGLSWHAAAKCENSLGNSTGEITNLLKSARQYAAAVEKDFQMGGATLGCDNLQDALNSYNLAISKYDKHSPLRVMVNLEIVNFLQRIGRGDHMEWYLKQAVETSATMGSTRIHCLDLLASHSIKTGDYLAALNILSEIVNLVEQSSVNGADADTLLKCEINRVLLLLILKPSPQNLTPELTKILERYTWGDRNDESLKNCRMSEHMFILLESLVTTCQSVDTTSLIDLEGQLWPLVSTEQRDMLRILVRIYYP